ncbi:MAG: phosphatidate cytidylyltransferase [Synergistaceae bacterium]|jgi:phosphatidate cytidylyltransferase|nr:phosphatidate cytidylyltransferase [Synergistaceae bacterium]
MGEFNKKNKSKTNLMLRTFSSFFIVGIILSGIYFGGVYWNVIVSLAAMLSLLEFYKIQSTKHDLSASLVLASGAFILLGTSLNMSLTSILCTISCIVFIALFIEILKHQLKGESFALENMGAVISGIAYIVLPWSFMIIIRERELGIVVLLALFLCTWSCDVAAYFVGTTFGRTKLCDKVSPHKTWEGFWGGVFASFICGGLLYFLFPSVPFFSLLLMGLLFGIAGQIGDLGESLLKREAGVKDAGVAIPGHGGFMDRFDSILINATLAFLILEIIG